MNEVRPFYTLHSTHSSLVIDCRANAPTILYWGQRLDDAATPGMLASLGQRQRLPARSDTEAPLALAPESAAGFPGNAGIQVHRDGKDWAIFSTIESVTGSDNGLTIRSRCAAAQVSIIHRLALDQGSDVLVASTELVNSGTETLAVAFCAAPTIPVPLHYDHITGFEGHWAGEFHMHTLPRFRGAYLRENRSGRTSHDAFPGVLLHPQHTHETAGSVYALHLGWSGNHSLRVEELADGRAYAQLGELLFPGELSLAPGASYQTPDLYGAHSDHGFSGVSNCLHRYVREHLVAEHLRGKPKRVHFNTWEALYFDLSAAALQDLVDEAAAIGIERFVLDDGWFRKRRSDAAGLGDWYVDESVFPDGLRPLVDQVHNRGMEFGLWIEPEMVNPDSDLYRSHPDWVLSAAPAPLQLSRKQLVLDLTRTEVTDYLFERIDALLSEYPVSYLKWDMNRELSQPGGKDGRVATHRYVLAVYALLRRVRAAHPGVEIESCASGGGRADYGILGLTDRIWTSDNNDALDRLRIQKGFSTFFPAEVMGAHVGPLDCHVTGRRIDMTMRAGVAMFGDMGVEANLLQMDAQEKQELASAIALHKEYRELIFSGDLVRLDMANHEHGFGIVADDRQQALFSYALLASPPRAAPGRYVFAGLDPAIRYDLKLIWPDAPGAFSQTVLEHIDSAPVSGAVLMRAGMQLPVLRPQEMFILHLQASAA